MSQFKNQKCARCKGSGVLPFLGGECDLCDGKGEIDSQGAASVKSSVVVIPNDEEFSFKPKDVNDNQDESGTPKEKDPRSELENALSKDDKKKLIERIKETATYDHINQLYSIQWNGQVYTAKRLEDIIQIIDKGF